MAIDLAEKSNGPTPELLASSPPDNSKWCGCVLLAEPKAIQGLSPEREKREGSASQNTIHRTLSREASYPCFRDQC